MSVEAQKSQYRASFDECDLRHGPIAADRGEQSDRAQDNSTIPPAKPSRPSARLTAFVMPMRKTKVMKIDTAWGSTTTLPIISVPICTLPTIMQSPAASTWPANLVR